MAGVAHMLHILRAELELVMAQLGCRTVDDLDKNVLFPPHAYAAASGRV
jgi:4-hydroxymandelate oxidase